MHRRQFGEPIVRTEQNAQLVQPRQIVGQRCQRIPGQIENLQRLGQSENLVREIVSPHASFRRRLPASLPARRSSRVFSGIQVIPPGWRDKVRQDNKRW